MRTEFTTEQLADPATAVAAGAIRKCVHCGFCTATCPTYVLLGDELDSPRGRIYLMQQMLEAEEVPSAEVVKHVDRCLSCLACTTTCPSGVDYMHLVDHARAYIEQRYRRPWHQWLVRAALAFVLPHPGRFRAALLAGRATRPLRALLARVEALRPIAAMLAMAPHHALSQAPRRVGTIDGAVGRVALLQGCAEPVLGPQIRAATLRLLGKLGYQAVLVPGEGCCGALVHHLGREADALAAARRNVDVWWHEIDSAGLDAILVTASGCGTVIKDYGFMLRHDPAYAERATRVSALAMDISSFLFAAAPDPVQPRPLKVAYHAACSLQHGQKVTTAPAALLARLGYVVVTPAEAHLCCGSAGTYNILQSEIAGQLGARKAANLDALAADVIAAGNIGCSMQIGQHAGTPVVHLVELVDWAIGGPAPAGLEALAGEPRVADRT